MEDGAVSTENDDEVNVATRMGQIDGRVRRELGGAGRLDVDRAGVLFLQQIETGDGWGNA